jgi:phage N-6-adenine-methyltransferase
MTIAPTLFSRASTEWETPSELVALLRREFSFTLDVCATATNHKCARYYTREQNGLCQRWTGTCWMNPPYGCAIGQWIAKALSAASSGATVVCLVPARTDTAWWQDLVMRASEIRLLRGRLTFVGAAAPAPFPSAVVIFDPKAGNSSRPHVIGWDWQAVPATRHSASTHCGRPSAGFLR